MNIVFSSGRSQVDHYIQFMDQWNRKDERYRLFKEFKDYENRQKCTLQDQKKKEGAQKRKTKDNVRDGRNEHQKCAITESNAGIYMGPESEAQRGGPASEGKREVATAERGIEDTANVDERNKHKTRTVTFCDDGENGKGCESHRETPIPSPCTSQRENGPRPKELVAVCNSIETDETNLSDSMNDNQSEQKTANVLPTINSPFLKRQNLALVRKGGIRRRADFDSTDSSVACSDGSTQCLLDGRRTPKLVRRNACRRTNEIPDRVFSPDVCSSNAKDAFLGNKEFERETCTLEFELKRNDFGTETDTTVENHYMKENNNNCQINIFVTRPGGMVKSCFDVLQNDQSENTMLEMTNYKPYALTRVESFKPLDSESEL